VVDFATCRNNVTMAAFYDCACYTTKVFDARLKAGFETAAVAMTRGRQVDLKISSGDLMEATKGNVNSCIAPSKIEANGTDMTARMLRPPTYSEERKRTVSACAGTTLAASFQARPAMELGHINQLLTDAVRSCLDRNP
jgi:hypothetical protein